MAHVVHCLCRLDSHSDGTGVRAALEAGGGGVGGAPPVHRRPVAIICEVGDAERAVVHDADRPCHLIGVCGSKVHESD
jgi:hypothetical protein